MPQKKRTNHKDKRSKRRYSFVPFLLLLVLVVFGAGIYLFFDKTGLHDSALQFVSQFQDKLKSFSKQTEVSEATLNIEDKNTVEESAGNSTSPKQTDTQAVTPDNETQVATSPPLLREVQNDLDVMFDNKGMSAKTQVTASAVDQCSKSAQVVNEFYEHLDNQPYLKTFHLSTSSSTHFANLIQELLDHPPVVSRETDDLFTILQNTAHFFRIIGKDNILLLKGILDREKDYFENVLNHYYIIITLHECPQKSFGITITKDALYDYAGFFLNTMGGRLYLFRRDSVSRMTVNYYAILIINQANIEENNRHGILLLPAIDNLITEIEASSQLRLKEIYLDTLYDLKEKYQ